MSRQKYHEMLDNAMNETQEGDFFLPQFVRLVMLDLQKPQTAKKTSKSKQIMTCNYCDGRGFDWGGNDCRGCCGTGAKINYGHKY